MSSTARLGISSVVVVQVFPPSVVLKMPPISPAAKVMLALVGCGAIEVTLPSMFRGPIEVQAVVASAVLTRPPAEPCAWSAINRSFCHSADSYAPSGIASRGEMRGSSQPWYCFSSSVARPLSTRALSARKSGLSYSFGSSQRTIGGRDDTIELEPGSRLAPDTPTNNATRIRAKRKKLLTETPPRLCF